MATFSILGSCICRDLFSLQDEMIHEIDTFLQVSSALTWFHYGENHPTKKIDPIFYEGIPGLTNFQKRCLVHDYNHTVFEQYTKKSDYFITDMTEFASMDIAKEVDEKNIEHYFTFSKWFSIAYKNGAKERFEHSIERIDHLEIITDEVIEDTIKKYAQWIYQQGYDQKQVIVIENKRAYMYTDGKLLYRFGGVEHRDKLNGLLDKIYACMRRELPLANFIKMPMGILSDKNHKWGLTDLHFCKEYYDFLYQSIEMIISKENAALEIEQLRDEYSILFSRKKEQCMYNSFEYADSKQLLSSAFSSRQIEHFVVEKGVRYYEDKECTILKGMSTSYYNAHRINRCYGEIEEKDIVYYVQTDEMKKGCIGAGQCLFDNWYTVNGSTVAIVKDRSVILGHNYSKSKAQMNLIYTLDNNTDLSGEIVTFSVYTRVLKHNYQGKGGTIAFINATDYNKGIFAVKEDFVNKEWKRVSITTHLPQGSEYQGLTICLRALAGTTGEDSALVEFSDPKLEIGTFPTKYIE